MSKEMIRRQLNILTNFRKIFVDYFYNKKLILTPLGNDIFKLDFGFGVITFQAELVNDVMTWTPIEFQAKEIKLNEEK